MFESSISSSFYLKKCFNLVLTVLFFFLKNYIKSLKTIVIDIQINLDGRIEVTDLDIFLINFLPKKFVSPAYLKKGS